MIKIKNDKSATELVAHDYKDGKIVFNPGSQTGAKKMTICLMILQCLYLVATFK